MPIYTKHPDYVANEKRVKKARDINKGQEQMHAAGSTYLPVPSGMSDKNQKREDGSEYNDFDNYVARTPFFNASSRTIEALTGLVASKNPSMEFPDRLEVIKENADLKGATFEAYFELVLDDMVEVDRPGTLIDYPTLNPGEALTLEDKEARNLRTRLCFYPRELIINWQEVTINNKTQWGRIVLKEITQVQKNADDIYELTDRTQYRELYLDDAGIYRQRLWTRQDNDADSGEGPDTYSPQEITPVIKGQTLSEIPFILHVSSKNSRSALEDLYVINIKHYQLSADCAHAEHFVCVPTPYIFGVNDTEVPDTFGPTNIWSAANPQANAGLIEFTGQGLQPVNDKLDRYEAQMGKLGARMLMPEPGKGPETATAEVIKSTGELSALQKIVEILNQDIKQIVNWIKRFEGLEVDDDAFFFRFSNELITSKLSAQEAVQLVTSWLQGAISKETLYYLLSKGGLTEPGVSFEDEQERIDNDPPPSLTSLDDEDEDEDDPEEDED